MVIMPPEVVMVFSILAGKVVKLNTHAAHDRDRDAVAFLDQSEQEVLSAYIIVPQADRLLTGNLHDFFNAIGKHSVHHSTVSFAYIIYIMTLRA